MIENEIYPLSIVSWIGILVNRLVTLYERRNFWERFLFLDWEVKRKVSLQE